MCDINLDLGKFYARDSFYVYRGISRIEGFKREPVFKQKFPKLYL